MKKILVAIIVLLVLSMFLDISLTTLLVVSYVMCDIFIKARQRNSGEVLVSYENWNPALLAKITDRFVTYAFMAAVLISTIYNWEGVNETFVRNSLIIGLLIDQLYTSLSKLRIHSNGVSIGRTFVEYKDIMINEIEGETLIELLASKIIIGNVIIRVDSKDAEEIIARIKCGQQ